MTARGDRTLDAVAELADLDCHSLRFARPSARHSLTDGPEHPR